MDQIGPQENPRAPNSKAKSKKDAAGKTTGKRDDRGRSTVGGARERRGEERKGGKDIGESDTPNLHTLKLETATAFVVTGQFAWHRNSV